MWDAVVVGLGGVGSFALRALARRSPSLRIIGLERFHIGHDKGSSHGGTRIYRHAYFEHPDYVPLLKYSTAEFHVLQEEMKRPIIEQCGNLIIERRRKGRRSGDTSSSSTPIIDACLESASRHSIKVELIEDQKQLSRRYPQFQFHRSHVGMIEPGGGYVRPETAVQAAIDDARTHGATIKAGITVESITEVDASQSDGHVVLRATTEEGKKEVVEARKVIVAGGPWTGHLLPQWSKYLCVTKQVQAWIDIGRLENTTNAEMYDPSMMPTWIREENEEANDDQISQPMLYGFPCDPKSEQPTWMKIALHGRDDPVNPEDHIQGSRDVNEAELDELRVAAVPFLRNIHPSQEFIHAKTCLYTCSPDDDFLVGRPKGHRHVVAAAGLSGHGFKMTPALGRALADMTVDSKTDLPIDFLRPSRFEG